MTKFLAVLCFSISIIHSLAEISRSILGDKSSDHFLTVAVCSAAVLLIVREVDKLECRA